MAILFKDRVKDSSSTTGTGDFTLSGSAPSGFITFNSAYGTGSTNQFYYCIDNGSEWEVGISYLSASTTLERGGVQTVLASSTGSAVSFSAGDKVIYSPLTAYEAEQGGIRRLSSTVVDTDVGTKQTLYTVPTGKKCIPTTIILRNATGNLSGYGPLNEGWSVGFSAGADDVIPFLGKIYIQFLTDATVSSQVHLTILQIESSVKIGSASDVLGLIFQDTAINQSVTVDVIGYLYNA